jgi:hypothetical protein
MGEGGALEAAFIAGWDGVVVMQRIRKERGRRESPVDHEVGRASAMALSQRELEWGKKGKEGMGFARRGGVRATASKRKREGRGSGTGARARLESRHRRREKEGGALHERTRRVRHHAAATREQGASGPSTDALHRIRSYENSARSSQSN